MSEKGEVCPRGRQRLNSRGAASLSRKVLEPSEILIFWTFGVRGMLRAIFPLCGPDKNKKLGPKW